MNINQSYINTYFAKHWHGDFNKYQLTGYSLIKKVTDDDLVLDVGCGSNPFRGKIKNLVGIDPANKDADIKTTIEDFKSSYKFDVAFCLGSINFGTEENIKEQIQVVVNCLTHNGKIYWRCNPGLQDHQNTEVKNMQFYPWSFEKHIELAKFFNFEVRDLQWDVGNRIYAEWIRKN